MILSSRNEILRSQIVAAIAVLVTFFWAEPIFAAENIWSVQKLNDSQPWDGFVGSPLPIKVEGRLSTYGKGQLRLAKCEAKFTIDNEKLRQTPTLNTKANVELKGRFKKNAGKIEFAVDELKVVDSFVVQFEVKASKLKLPTPEDWIELGDWGMERARFYEDDELIKKAKKAYGNAIELEYNSTKFADADGRRALAKKIEEYELSDQWRMELVHESLRLQWKAIQKAEPPEPDHWQQFAATLEKQLPDATKPLKTIPVALNESYERDPDSTYRKSKDEIRRQLHRLFFISVMRKYLLNGASSDGHDGDTIADKIDNLIPEEHTTADAFRAAKLDFRFGKISVATRSEAENLSAAYRDRGQQDQAKQVLQQWIQSHEGRLKDDGIVGMMQLADEYLSLLNDEKSAVEWLSDAYAIDPKFEAITTRLSGLGYQIINGRWTKSTTPKSQVSKREDPPSTELSLGMSASDLRKLLGQPRSLARTITARGITEVWSFGPIGSSLLVVRLEQKSRDGEPRIVAYSGQ